MALTESRVFLSLGGNLGEPQAAMGEALRTIDAAANATVAAVSALYRTPPWGKLDQPDFLNAAAEIRTTLPPRGFLDLCLSVEKGLKRERRERWGPRLIDLDILLFGDLRVDEPGLDIPHPRMLERAFVLAPLADIAPALVVDGATIATYLSRLDLTGIVRMPGGTAWWRPDGSA